MHFKIGRAETPADLGEIGALFRAYAESLPVTLDYQNFDEELGSLPGKYALPDGILLLARDIQELAVGCVAVRPTSGLGVCEIKRLFLKPSARGQGLGLALAQAAISHARNADFVEVRLDTLPSMTGAIRLYEQLGFSTIDAYYSPTPPGTVFMRLML